LLYSSIYHVLFYGTSEYATSVLHGSYSFTENSEKKTDWRYRTAGCRGEYRDVTREWTDRQCAYKRNIEARSRNHCCRGKPVSIIYSECMFVVLVIQHAKRMRRIILSSG